MCRARGVTGRIAEDISVADFLAEAPSAIDHYGAVTRPGAAYPPRLVEPIGRLLEASAVEAADFARAVLGASATTPGAPGVAVPGA
jgi:hypothetical protein